MSNINHGYQSTSSALSCASQAQSFNIGTPPITRDVIAAILAQLSQPAPSEAPPGVHPKRKVAAAIEEFDARLKNLENDFGKKQNATEHGTNDADDADDEDETQVNRRKKKQKRIREPKKLLSIGAGMLNAKQKETRNELQRLVAKAIAARAGDVKTYISPQQNTELPAERFKFDERVDSFNNLQILEKAARQVYQGQTNEETTELTYKAVKFTYADVLYFAKVKFRAWKAELDRAGDELKAKKKGIMNTKNKRKQRKRHRKEDRFKAVNEYKAKFKLDPSPFLSETEWMSSEVSELDTDDDQKKDLRRIQIAKTIGMNPTLMKDEVVWEVIRPVWRNPMISEVYDNLDKIRAEERKKTKKEKNRLRTKRVNLGRKSDDTPFPRIYPIMLNTEWYKEYLGSCKDDCIFTKGADPEGWNNQAQNQDLDGDANDVGNDSDYY